jgi:hypothetical protein
VSRTLYPRKPLSQPLVWEEMSGRSDPRERFRLYRVGRDGAPELVATCGTPEAVGVALVTLGREGEWLNACVGVLDSQGEKGQRWLSNPWSPLTNL